jgi:hypothetical protein
MTVQRESDKHGRLHDENLKHELEGTLRGNRPSRAEEWRDPEPPADDDPNIPPFSGDRAEGS